MIPVVLLPAATVLVALAAGGLLLAAVPVTPARRAVLLPAAPALGLAAVIVVLHWTSLVLPTRPVGPVLVALIALGLAVLAWRRPDRFRLPDPRRVLVDLGVALAIGAVAGGLALVPNARLHRPTVVMPSLNHDAFWYVTVADWLGDHDAYERTPSAVRPGPGAASPFLGPADRAVRETYRIGESLVQAAVAGTAGRAVRDTWSPTTAAWLVVLPGSVIALVRLARLRRSAAFTAAALAGWSAALVGQAFDQNGPSLLALALAPVAVGLVLAAARDPAPSTGDRILAGIALSGALGAYSELAALLGLPLAVAALTGPGGWRVALRRTAITLAVAIAVCPIVWVRLVNYLAYLTHAAGADTGFVSAYWSEPPLRIANRVAGLIDQEGLAAHPLGLLVVAVVLAGIVVAFRLRAARPFGWGVLAVTLAATAVFGWIYTGIAGLTYLNGRIVDLAWPLLVALAAASLTQVAADALTRRDERAPATARRWGPVAAGAVGIAALAVALANLDVSWDAAWAGRLDGRTIDPGLRQAIAATESYVAPDGSDLTVLIDDYVPLLWTGELMNDRPGVAYGLTPLGYADRDAFIGPDLTRYVLTSDQTLAAIAPEAVVWTNDAYTLFDTTAGPSLVVLAKTGFWNAERGADGIQRWMADDGRILVARTQPCPVSVVAQSLNTAGDQQVTVTEGPRVVGELPVGVDPTAVQLPLTDAAISVLGLDNPVPAQRPEDSPGDSRRLSILLRGVGWTPGSTCATATATETPATAATPRG